MNEADSEVMERFLEKEGVAPIHRSVLFGKGRSSW